MKTRMTRLLAACVVAMSIPVAASAEPGDPLDPRTYAPESKPFLTLNASGVQRYACQANGQWLFTDPVAELYEPGRSKVVGSHYLNFATGRRCGSSRTAAPSRRRGRRRRPPAKGTSRRSSWRRSRGPPAMTATGSPNDVGSAAEHLGRGSPPARARRAR